MLFNPQTAASILVTLGLLAAGGTSQAQTLLGAALVGDSLSLETTVRAVLEANPSLHVLQQEVNQTQARLAESRTALRPVVTGTAQATRVDPVVKFPFDGQEVAFAPNNNYDVHVGGQYTLLDFGRNRATIEASRSRIATATDNLSLSQRDLAFSATQTYYGILFAREAVRVQDQQIASLRQHQQEMQQRVVAGVSTNFDVTTTKVRIAQARDRKIDLENQLHNQEVQLARLLHRAEGEVLPVRGRLAYRPQAVDVRAALAAGAQNRPEVKLALDAEQTAVAQQRVTEAGNHPSLNVLAQAGAKNGYLLPSLDRMRFNTIVGGQLNVPLYDGGRNKAQRVEAVAALKGAQAHTEDTQLQVRADVRQAVNNLQAGAARYDNSQTELTEATDALRRAQARYRYGVGSNLDVLDAETQLAQARLARLQAIYTYTLGQYELRRATGEQIW